MLDFTLTLFRAESHIDLAEQHEFMICSHGNRKDIRHDISVSRHRPLPLRKHSLFDADRSRSSCPVPLQRLPPPCRGTARRLGSGRARSEEHTSELQSLMRISYAVFCLKTKKTSTTLTAAIPYLNTT